MIECMSIGKLNDNGVTLMSHELDTVRFLLDHGYDVELVIKSNIERTTSPDIIMESVPWEIKSPIGSGKWVIKNIMQKAAHQSENLIIDLRRMDKQQQKKRVQEVKSRFELSRRFRRLKIITGDGVLLDFRK